MKHAVAAVAAAALAAGCLEAPPSGGSGDASPGDLLAAAHVGSAMTYYLARGGRMTGGAGDDLLVVGERADGSHLGVVMPSAEGGLEASLQEAVWFEVGDQRANDAIAGFGQGALVARIDGQVTVLPAGAAPLVLELAPGVTSPIVAVAPFPSDPRLMVAGTDRLWMQEDADETTVHLKVVGTTLAQTVFMDVLMQPQDDPIDDIPFLGVVDGSTLGLYQIISGGTPQLGPDRAGDAVLPITPAGASWHHVEGSAQALSFEPGSTMLHWYRVAFDGTQPSQSYGTVEDVDEILDVQLVQLDINQLEVVVVGRRNDGLVVVAYMEAIGFGGLNFTNGEREWLAADDLDEVPLLAAADLEVDTQPGGDELVLVESSGRVHCLDVTESALVESCGTVQIAP